MGFVQDFFDSIFWIGCLYSQDWGPSNTKCKKTYYMPLIILPHDSRRPMVLTLLKGFVALQICGALSFNVFGQNPIEASVQLNVLRSVEGVSTFDRNVFINMHSTHTSNSWETYELSEVVEELGINFGRTVGGVTWQLNRINEDSDRPGYFNLSHMQALGQESRDFYESRKNIHQFASSDF